MRYSMMMLVALAMMFALTACGEAAANNTPAEPQGPASPIQDDSSKQNTQDRTEETNEQANRGDMYLLKVEGMT